jgi:hypothetical protein
MMLYPEEQGCLLRRWSPGNLICSLHLFALPCSHDKECLSGKKMLAKRMGMERKAATAD